MQSSIGSLVVSQHTQTGRQQTIKQTTVAAAQVAAAATAVAVIRESAQKPKAIMEETGY